jgi:hypothetical protein
MAAAITHLGARGKAAANSSDGELTVLDGFSDRITCCLSRYFVTFGSRISVVGAA